MNSPACSASLRVRVARRVGLAVVVSLGLGSYLAAAQEAARKLAALSGDEVPTWLQGLWTREWIEKGKKRSDTLDVLYLQTPSYFADLRIPRDRPDFSGATSFVGLTEQQLRWLAGQDGFTGRTTIAEKVARWQHNIEFQPPDGTSDEGRLERISPHRMHEHGLDGSYIESWRSLTEGSPRFLVIRVEHAGRLLQTLLVVDNQFVYIRNRARDLPVAPSLDSLIVATHATREQIVQYLDCEFSAGRVSGGSAPWEIQKSTLPWREGHRLEFVDQVRIVDGRLDVVPRQVNGDQWSVPVNTLSPEKIRALFSGVPLPGT